MSNSVFDFADTSRVSEELPPQEQPVISMNGWPFSAKPKTPYQREFKITLYGMRWYLSAGGGSLDKTTNAKYNVGKLLDFYKSHRLWDSFLINHEYLGTLRVRFSKPVTVSAGEINSNGLVPAVEINLVEHQPGY